MSYPVSNFSSVYEIAFAVNFVLYIFELKPFLEKQFNDNILNLGEELLREQFSKEDFIYITTYGWRGTAFAYVLWLGRLKIVSFFNSALSLILLIISGFNPEFSLGIILSIIILMLFFFPVICVSCIILYILPSQKLNCIKGAIDKLIEKERGILNDTDFTNLENKYKSIVNMIELSNFTVLFLFKNRKNIKDPQEWLNLFNQTLEEDKDNKQNQ
jgi:hypothetical protein